MIALRHYCCWLLVAASAQNDKKKKKKKQTQKMILLFLLLFVVAIDSVVQYAIPTGVRTENSVVFDSDPYLRCDGVAAPFNGRLRFTGLRFVKPPQMRHIDRDVRFTLQPILLEGSSAYPRNACNLGQIGRAAILVNQTGISFGRSSCPITTNADDDSEYGFNTVPDNANAAALWSFLADFELDLNGGDQLCMLDCVVASIALRSYGWTAAAVVQAPSGSEWQAVSMTGNYAPQWRDNPTRLTNVARLMPAFMSNASATWPGMPLATLTLPLTNTTDTVEGHGLQRIVDAGPCARITLRLSHRSGVAWIAINGLMVWCGGDRHHRCRLNNPDNQDIQVYDTFAQEIDPGNIFLRADRKQVIRVVFYSRAQSARYLDVEVVVQEQQCPPCYQAVSPSLYVDGFQSGCSSNTLTLIGPRSNWTIGRVGGEIGRNDYVYNFTSILSARGPLVSSSTNELRVGRFVFPPLLPTCNAVSVFAFFATDVYAFVGNRTVFPCADMFNCNNAQPAMPRLFRFSNSYVNAVNVLNLTSLPDRSQPLELTLFYTSNWLRSPLVAPVIVATVPVSQVDACFGLPTPAPTPEPPATVVPVTTFPTVTNSIPQNGATTTTSTNVGGGGDSSSSGGGGANVGGEASGDNTTLIVAIVVSLVVVFLLLVVCLFFVRRSRQRRAAGGASEVGMKPSSSGAFGRYGGLPQEPTKTPDDSGTLKLGDTPAFSSDDLAGESARTAATERPR
jgi:hypothetical protein